jgi:hypothetical protein
MKEESTEGWDPTTWLWQRSLMLSTVTQEPKETFLVSITVPAPQTDASFGYDITFTLSPRKIQHTSTCQNQATLAPLSLSPIPAPSTVATPPTSVSTSLSPPQTRSGDHFEVKSTGEFTHLIAIYPNDGLLTLPMVQPETNPSGGYGRKYKAFYVVSRGRRTGVFHDYW